MAIAYLILGICSGVDFLQAAASLPMTIFDAVTFAMSACMLGIAYFSASRARPFLNKAADK